ncbi:hypothetical protein PCANC_02023 [Puccinia coronata f. sp. avenae]|uniref:Tet-like 2OG-Fe(II) oxygenase domain-containing protein n=1 Tax=Puccinia coronata f. sp. avenae TaxID=200324 RepID=A0A2N5W1X5_9BASI|nr:hypothetical protein PCANC_02023 [Puccinia coronata f. sp. avenae]
MTNPQGPASLPTPSAQDNNTHDANGLLRTRSANLTYAAVITPSAAQGIVRSPPAPRLVPVSPGLSRLSPGTWIAPVSNSGFVRRKCLERLAPVSTVINREDSLDRLAPVHRGFAVANSLAGSQLAGVAVINCEQLDLQDTLALAGVAVINCERLQDTLAPICQLAGIAVIDCERSQDTLAPILVSPAVAISSTDPELAGIQINPGTVCKQCPERLAPVSLAIAWSSTDAQLIPVSPAIIPKQCLDRRTKKITAHSTTNERPAICFSSQIAAMAAAKRNNSINGDVHSEVAKPEMGCSELLSSDLRSLEEDSLPDQSDRSSSLTGFSIGHTSKKKRQTFATKQTKEKKHLVKQPNQSSSRQQKHKQQGPTSPLSDIPISQDSKKKLLLLASASKHNKKRKQPVKQKTLSSTSQQVKQPAGSVKLTAHQRQRRNKRVNERRKGKRETNRGKDFTTAPPPPEAHIVTRKMNPIDLFPEIIHDFCQRYLEFQRQTAKHKKYPKRYPKPNQIFPRNPTNIENNKALETVKEDFYLINNNYNMIYDERTGELVALAEFIHLDKLSESQRNDYDFLCLFLHWCKEFISPVASKSRSCGGVMWAIGWRKGYDGLEILDQLKQEKSCGTPFTPLEMSLSKKTMLI